MSYASGQANYCEAPSLRLRTVGMDRGGGLETAQPMDVDTEPEPERQRDDTEAASLGESGYGTPIAQRLLAQIPSTSSEEAEELARHLRQPTHLVVRFGLDPRIFCSPVCSSPEGG